MPHPTDPYPPARRGKLISTVPVTEGHALRVQWPLPTLLPHWREAPDAFLGHLIGHEGAGSLFASLKEQGWVRSLSAGGMQVVRGHDAFTVSMMLTDDGVLPAPSPAKSPCCSALSQGHHNRSGQAHARVSCAPQCTGSRRPARRSCVEALQGPCRVACMRAAFCMPLKQQSGVDHQTGPSQAMSVCSQLMPVGSICCALFVARLLEPQSARTTPFMSSLWPPTLSLGPLDGTLMQHTCVPSHSGLSLLLTLMCPAASDR